MIQAIDQKIQSYGSLKADIKFVDAQESYNGGVIVLVTGSMINADDSRRAFTQTFFLAPQDKGFFVLNDIFRYVEDDCLPNEHQDGGIAPTTPSQGDEMFLFLFCYQLILESCFLSLQRLMSDLVLCCFN